jgi:hypothetical protein
VGREQTLSSQTGSMRRKAYAFHLSPGVPEAVTLGRQGRRDEGMP